MTPETLARSLVASPEPETRATGVAIILRGLTDDTDTRQGWPLIPSTARRAAHYVGIADPSAELIDAALRIAPTLDDAILNRGAAR